MDLREFASGEMIRRALRTIGTALASMICAVLASWPDGVAAAPSVRTKTIYYEVYASTSQQLRSQMSLHGPRGFWANARWYVRWTGDCRLSVELTYTMPKWANKDLAPPALQRRWDAMIEKLWLHERGHGQFAIEAAREIERVGCHQAQRIMRKLRRQNEAYDRRTKHGRTQGVRLP